MKRETWRDKRERRLREIWDTLSVPHIPSIELRRLTDETVVMLIGHWSQKQLEASKQQEIDRLNHVDHSEFSPGVASARFVNRSQTGGGYLTPRQCVVS